jgi:ribonuclease HII
MDNLTSLKLEKQLAGQGISLIAGIDEVGRGSLAGPVAAAIVGFPIDVEEDKLAEVTDSKKLSSRKRENLSSVISGVAVICEIGFSSAQEIDDIGIVNATKLAMKRALAKSVIRPEYLLVDALDLSELKIPCKAIIKGDQISTSIAAASIIAKVSRDALMTRFNDLYPNYKFDANKGYGTNIHIEALKKHGPSPIHRNSFAPIYNLKND